MIDDKLAPFTELVAEVQAREGYVKPKAFGIGIATTDGEGNFLDTYFPVVNFEENYGTAALLSEATGHLSGTAHYELDRQQIVRMHDILRCFAGDGKRHENIEVIEMLMMHGLKNPRQKILAVFIDADDQGPVGVPDIYLRLHLLSYRKVLPNTIKAEPGLIMPLLPNVAWTSQGPLTPDDANRRLLQTKVSGTHLRIFAVDKLPHMLDYVVPKGVRIADTARVRLGAHVGDGTTVMPVGAINFNAGTRGPAMIEGRISQGVIVGEGSDLGGGSSTQGTMSGGNTTRIEVGDRSLIGALAGIGISLGDDCKVAAGLYLMPGTMVELIDNDGYVVKTVDVAELSGQSGLLFLRSGQGKILVRPNKKAVVLNPLLHKN